MAMKRKIISMLLIASMIVISTTSCGKEKPAEDKKVSAGTEKTKSTNTQDYEPAGVTKKEYKNMTAQDLLDRIKDLENLTEDEAVELVSTFAYVDYDEEFNREENITDEALKEIRDAGGSLPDSESFLETLITSENAKVRAYGFGELGGFLSDTLGKTVKETLDKETDQVVLYAAIDSLSSCGEDPYFAKFFIKMAENENPRIREEAAFAIGNRWSIGAEGMEETITKLMEDEDENVRATACSRAGELANDELLEPLMEILNDPDKIDLHDECFESLMTMWLDSPFYNNMSEAAYRATIDYLSTTPRTEGIPSWDCVFRLRNIDEEDLDEWKTKATYYDSDEICNIMIDILADPEADWLARNQAISVILTIGSDTQKEKLKSTVEGLTDDEASYLQEQYAEAIEES